MARRVRDVKLESRSAREKLQARGKPYYRSVGQELHLGYRKGTKGGSWVVRQYVGDRDYKVETIAYADDRHDADGQRVLDFWQAQERARAMYRKVSDRKAGPAPTVKLAAEEYLSAREANGAPDESYRLKLHVLKSPIAEKRLDSLDASDLSEWRSALSSKGLKPGTVGRIATDLKAALNGATLRHSKSLPAGFPLTVRHGLKPLRSTAPAARPAQVLPDGDVRAVLAAASVVDEQGGWDGDLHRLLVVMAATGARFSQVVRITVGDVQVEQGRIMVPVSRKGQGAKAVTHTARHVGPDVLAALKSEIVGRKGHEPLLLRPRWKQTGPMTWIKASRGPWLNPSELSRPWKVIRLRAELSADVVPYSLRHSSIVRALREGLPVRFVAAQHDTSSAMIEKHYAAYIVDALDAMAARAVVPLLTAPLSMLKQVDAA